jgi:hypothetical protein
MRLLFVAVCVWTLASAAIGYRYGAHHQHRVDRAHAAARAHDRCDWIAVDQHNQLGVLEMRCSDRLYCPKPHTAAAHVNDWYQVITIRALRRVCVRPWNATP